MGGQNEDVHSGFVRLQDVRTLQLIDGFMPMMSRQDKLLETLASGRRLCDDCLSEISEIKPRQSVYQACSVLRDEKMISRLNELCESCNRMKIVNALVSKTRQPAKIKSGAGVSSVMLSAPTLSSSSKPWYWEGHVQTEIVHYLKASNASVQSEANTSIRERGIDIEAVDIDGSPLWISVKGFPEKSANTQARHWFAGALLDLALYKDKNPKARLAVGLPSGFSTYENLVKRVRNTLAFLGCHIFWVTERGTVTREVI